MPQAAAAAALDLVAAELSAAVVNAVYAASYVAFNVAFAVGTSALVSALNKPPGPADRRNSVRLTLGPRPVHFGRTLAGSSVVYDDVAGKVRWQVHVHNHGKVQNLIERRFGGVTHPVDIDGELLPFSRFQDSPYAEFHDGSEDQAASVLMRTPDLRKSFAVAPGWTDQHRLRGLAYSVIRAPSVKAEKFSEIYPEGRPPVPTIVADFGDPYDPRTDRRAFTPNGALLYAWWLTHPLGGQLPESRIDWPAFADAADAADRLGYELAGGWSASEAPKSAQANMLAALDAAMWTDQNGKVRLQLGEWREPAVRLGHDEVQQVLSLSTGSEEGDDVTELIVKYPDRARDYGDVEDVAASVAGPLYSPKTAELSYCPTKEQALRLGRRIFRRENAKWRLEATLNLAGLRLINQRTVEIHLPDFGLHHEVMELDSWGFDLKSGQVSIQARSIQASDFT